MNALASILAPISGDFGAGAGLELMLVGAACGAVGVWVVSFGQAFLAESFTHALLPGLVIAAIVGGSLVVGAALGLALAYGLSLLLIRTPKTSASSATAVMVTTLVALGGLLAARSGSVVHLEALLFGDPLTATNRTVITSIMLVAIVALVLFAMHGRFAVLAFDRSAAQALGIGVGGVTAAMLALFVISIAIAANAAGSLLALALVTGPAIGALALTRRIGTAIMLATMLGSACGIGGLFVSYYADWPAGASVALLACAVAMLPRLGSAFGQQPRRTERA